MKKFLIALNVVIWSLVSYQVAHAADTKPAEKKQAAPAKKEVKKHKKAEGTKVPDAPAKKADSAKKK